MTKKTIEKLENQIKEEHSQLEARIAELSKSNMEDQAVLDTYVERFTQAVQDAAGEKVLSALEQQRNQALKRVEQNNEIIRILTKEEGSKMRRLSADLVKVRLEAIEELENRALALYEKLKPHYDALSSGIHELYEMQSQSYEHRVSIDRTQLDDADRENFGLKKHIGLRDQIHKSKMRNIVHVLLKLPTFVSIKEQQRRNAR